MEPMTFRVDAAQSKIAMRTRSAGMLARLAHDLELSATDMRGSASRNGEGFSGELVVVIAGLRVTGQLHGDRVDREGISKSDRSEIEHKIRDEVFAGTKEIHVRALGNAWTHADATVDAGHGQMSISVSVRSQDGDGATRISGRTELSLAKLGVREIKGPLGAFKVKDAVEVLFEIILRPAG